MPNNARMLGVSPALLENQLQLMEHFMGLPTLSTPLLAMIGMLVSKACRSPYCQNLNSGLLLKAGFTREQIETMVADPTQAPLNAKQEALLLFVLEACENPHEMAAGEVDQLRSLGWGEADIVDAAGHGARMAWTNIIFNTFKIDPDCSGSSEDR